MELDIYLLEKGISNLPASFFICIRLAELDKVFRYISGKAPLRLAVSLFDVQDVLVQTLRY
ncbi:hypothetical protein JOD18_004088 [Gracilibacillus alcaliphilus]|nr:hypothetical protein [Gracilibacillus alcaliphilus]